MATTTTAENKELVHEYMAAWADSDPAATMALLADDFSTAHVTLSGEELPLDIEGFRELMTGYFAVFSDLGHEVHEMVAEADRVMVRITYSGTHDGAFLGIEPTGTRVEVEEFLSFRIADGEIVELHWLGDNLDLLRQLGVDLPIDA
jgi:steroid delta-isomerase-like uncharacterized protein